MAKGTHTSLEDLARSERTLLPVRWVAAAFAAAQVLAYDASSFPSPSVRPLALSLAGGLGLLNVLILVALPHLRTAAEARTLSLGVLTADVAITGGFVWMFSFDPPSAAWGILLILPLEGALKFGLSGAVGTWAIVSLTYVFREVWGSGRYGYDLGWNAITFRIGVALLVAMVAGLMARDLTDQRARLRHVLEEVRRTDALRARLVSTLAHDVRNPLTTIRGTLRTLLSHRDRVPPETQHRLLETADLQSARLERLATDLLELARLESGTLDLSVAELPLREAVAKAVEFTDGERQVQVLIDPDLRVKADPGRLEQIVVNLVSNALRYGAPPYTVEASGEDGRVTLAFRDQGPGISPEERELLFEPFRAENDTGSVGLGLAIVKALVEAHGGEVAYRPNEPTGACFLVTLPAAAAAREADAPGPSEHPGSEARASS